MNRFTFTFYLLATTVMLSVPAVAQQNTDTRIADSINAILPQLSGQEKLDAIGTLIDLSACMPAERYYVDMYLKEARLQKSAKGEGWALQYLTLMYYLQFDTDSIFIFGEEAIRFNRQHKQYTYLFSAWSEMIRGYTLRGQMLIALRQAEEAYAEAKELQENNAMACILFAMADILEEMEQYDEMVSCLTESIALIEDDYLSIFSMYDYLAYVSRKMNRPQEILRYADSMNVWLDREAQTGDLFNLQPHYFHREYHRVMAYADMKQPEKALEALRRAEAIYDTQWNEMDPNFAIQMTDLHATYNIAAGNYDKALEYLNQNLNSVDNDRTMAYRRKIIAQVYFEKGDYKTAAEIYSQILKKKEELNRERFYAQINELRTLYKLDKSEMESERRMAAIRQQRTTITGLAFACVAMIVIITLVVWSRRRIAEKNKGLYLQIKEQDRMTEELHQLRTCYEISTISKSEEMEVETDKSLSLNKNTKQLQLVNKLYDYLLYDKNFAKFDIDYKELVPILATNKTYLFEAVKKVTGRTLQEYINYIRLDEIKKIMESDSKYTLETIAMECGFNTYQTFYRLFKKRYNLSPAEYAKLAKTKIHEDY